MKNTQIQSLSGLIKYFTSQQNFSQQIKIDVNEQQKGKQFLQKALAISGFQNSKQLFDLLQLHPIIAKDLDNMEGYEKSTIEEINIQYKNEENQLPNLFEARMIELKCSNAQALAISQQLNYVQSIAALCSTICHQKTHTPALINVIRFFYMVTKSSRLWILSFIFKKEIIDFRKYDNSNISEDQEMIKIIYKGIENLKSESLIPFMTIVPLDIFQKFRNIRVQRQKRRLRQQLSQYIVNLINSVHKEEETIKDRGQFFKKRFLKCLQHLDAKYLYPFYIIERMGDDSQFTKYIVQNSKKDFDDLQGASDKIERGALEEIRQRLMKITNSTNWILYPIQYQSFVGINSIIHETVIISQLYDDAVCAYNSEQRMVENLHVVGTAMHELAHIYRDHYCESTPRILEYFYKMIEKEANWEKTSESGLFVQSMIYHLSISQVLQMPSFLRNCQKLMTLVTEESKESAEEIDFIQIGKLFEQNMARKNLKIEGDGHCKKPNIFEESLPMNVHNFSKEVVGVSFQPINCEELSKWSLDKML